MEGDSGSVAADAALAQAAKSTVGVQALVEPALVDLKGAQAFLCLSGPSVRAEMCCSHRIHAGVAIRQQWRLNRRLARKPT
jgi:hypothetical protein